MMKYYWLWLWLFNSVHASTPVWTFTPLTSTSGSIPSNINFQIKYLITNQSMKAHQLVLQPINGVTQDTSGPNCKDPFILTSKQSCMLVLTVDGSKISSAGGILGGPKVCQQNGAGLQCYQPRLENQLYIQSVGAVSIGDSYGGGIVACLDGDKNNLIAANTDFNTTGMIWGGDNNTQSLALSYSNGADNTQKIINCLSYQRDCPIPPTTPIDINTYAAGVCANYRVNSAGDPCLPGQICYDDWFLPAVDPSSRSSQLNCLYTHRNKIGGFSNQRYWSSSQGNGTNLPTNYAWFLAFNTIGSIDGSLKSSNYRIRCVRSFSPMTSKVE